MNTAKTWQTVSSKQDDTIKIAERFGRACKGGEVFLLVSDLGGGKTTFVKGLARGLGSNDVVTSPTFMVSRVYEAPHLTLHHFDFYRLQESGMVGMELDELLSDPRAVIAIEWGDVVRDVLPMEHFVVKLERVQSGEYERKITITCPDKYAYIMQELV